MQNTKRDWAMDKWDDTIDAYLNGHLDGQEMRDFEQAVAADEVLASELAFRKDLKAAMLQEEGKQLRQRIQEVTQSAQTRVKKRSWIPWSAVAGIVFVLGMTYLWFGQDLGNSKTPEEIFATYYSPEPSFDVMRTIRRKRQGMTAAEWEQLYIKKQFPEIVEKMAQLPDSLKNLDLLYLEAVALAETGESLKAIVPLDEILESPNTVLAGKTRYLKALLFIRSNRLAGAKLTLGMLKIMTPNYKEEAVSELLNWLETRKKQEDASAH